MRPVIDLIEGAVKKYSTQKLLYVFLGQLEANSFDPPIWQDFSFNRWGRNIKVKVLQLRSFFLVAPDKNAVIQPDEFTVTPVGYFHPTSVLFAKGTKTPLYAPPPVKTESLRLPKEDIEDDD